MAGGSRPGERRGGRQKGTPNRATLAVAERLAALGCDPIEGMANLALDPSNTPELRARMYAELAQYVAPKRKAVEHSGPSGEAIRHDHRHGTLPDYDRLSLEELQAEPAPLFFLDQFVFGYDPRRLLHLPLVAWPRQRDYVAFLHDCATSGQELV